MLSGPIEEEHLFMSVWSSFTFYLNTVVVVNIAVSVLLPVVWAIVNTFLVIV